MKARERKAMTRVIPSSEDRDRDLGGAPDLPPAIRVTLYTLRLA
jgi:hypothetical protein